MRKRYLIVGGGFIGGHVAAALAACGHEVAVISRSFSPWLVTTLAAQRLDVELIEASMPQSLGAVQEVAGAFVGRDAVYFLAGDSTPALSDREPAASTVELLAAGVSVLDQARRAGCERVVLASSGGTVYGRVEQVPTPETHPTVPISLHGVSSLALESYAEFFSRTEGLDTVVLRYSNVYGPGQRSRHGQGVIAAWIDAFARFERPRLIGDGSAQRDFLNVADAASAALAALTAEPGVYNVGAGQSWSLDAVHALLRDATGRELELERRAARSVDVPRTELDSTRFRAATGWAPAVDLPEGIRETWSWIPTKMRSSAGVAEH